MDDPWLRPKDAPAAPLTWPGFSSSTDPDADLVAAVRDAFAVSAVRRITPNGRGPRGQAGRQVNALEIRGRFLIPSNQAYERIAPRFRDLGHQTLFRRAGADQLIYAVPGEAPTEQPRKRLAIALFVATALSVLYVGAVNESGSFTDFNLLIGLPYALSLLAILVAHESGHYLMARRNGVPSSLPYLIPLPIPPIGTMGAVMQMKAPPKNRGALLAVGAAGPIAGLLVAIPVLILGLSLSSVQPSPPSYIQEGNSLLYAALKFLVKGQLLPGNGVDVMLHPVAWAGWTGLLVTSLNLIPAGQLDGGHMAYVLLGERAKSLTLPIIVALVVLGLTFWQGWLLWAGLVFLLGQVHATPLDDVTPPTAGERRLALFMLIVFVLVFMPSPLIFVG